MNKFLKIAANKRLLPAYNNLVAKARTFLSQAYYCNEVWDDRLKDPLFKKINLDEFYSELEQRHHRTGGISAVDVDVFANAAKEDIYENEMLDLVHRLRLSVDTKNALASMPHAVIRYFIKLNQIPALVNALDDRLNYGLFLDHYTANLLLDICWKNKDFCSGARVAAQLMLQEDVDHPLFSALALLHGYNYLLNPTEWPVPEKAEEPEDDVKVRVPQLRHPYFDDHFDLQNGPQIIGKTITMITRNSSEPLDQALQVFGLALHGKHEQVKQAVTSLQKFPEELLKLIPDDSESKPELSNLPRDAIDIQTLLQERVKHAEQSVAEKDIANQCDVFSRWEQERKEALEVQRQRLLNTKRLSTIDEVQKKLKEKETLLWYFENEEKVELEIEEKERLKREDEAKKYIPKKKDDEIHIPYEVSRPFRW